MKVSSTDKFDQSQSQDVKQWLGFLQVGQKIGLGYGLAVVVAVFGTTAGFLIGDSHHKEALEKEESYLNAYTLVNNLQNKALLIRLDLLELPTILDDPELLKKQYVSLLTHKREFKEIWLKFKSKFQDTKEEETIIANNISIQQFLKTYDQFPINYIQQVEQLIKSLELSEIQATNIKTTKAELDKFNNAPLSIKIEDFARESLSLSQEMYEGYEKAEAEFAVAQKLRFQIFLASAIFSFISAILLATLTSRAISRPLKSVTNVALKVTENNNFELLAPVTSQDEIGTLANSFNQMIQRVKTLLLEKEQRAEELQQINEKLKTTQKQMIAQEKLASLGSLTAGIAHEIRNPLNFVNNFAQLSVELTEELLLEIKEQIEQLEPEVAESITDTIDILQTNVSKIEHHGKRAEKIVANMLLHARSSEQQNWEKPNLNELLDETVNLAYHGMRAKDTSFKVNFDTDYDESINEITVVPQDISRAFINIISNACYAVQQKQQQLDTKFAPVIKIRTKNLGEKIEIRIRDNGLGMTPEVRDRIFEHFFTTKPTGEGTGLGLSLTYEIITQQHQGTLEVESQPGDYAEFIITLPCQNNLSHS
ncbi:MAG: ATP-binding protein [Nostocales cyanobacterium 94392]|nr:ATP-binding protein [Nostocales cyanobacterium 94392]